MSQISNHSCIPNRSYNKSKTSMNMDQAVAVVKQNFDLLDTAAGIGGKDGLIGIGDLKAIMHTPAAPKNLKEAAAFLLNNPAYRNQLDVAAGIGKVDGLIGKNDVDAYQKTHAAKATPISGPQGSTSAQVPGSFVPANNVRLKQFVQSAKQAATMGGSGAPTKSAPRPTGGAQGAGAVPANSAASEVKNAAQVLKKNWDKLGKGKNNTVDKERLKDVVASNWASPALKKACNTILNTPGAYETIFSAHKDGKSNLFFNKKGMSLSDINTVTSAGNNALASNLGGATASAGGVKTAGPGQVGGLAEAASTLKKYKKQVGLGKNKTIDQDRLKDIVASDWAPPKLKAAANFILNTKGAYATIFSAHEDGNKNSFFNRKGLTMSDINTVASPGFAG